jgi:hypothetical protein
MALYALANQAGALFRSALNTVLGKLQRNYFGSTDPASVNESTAGMWWVDTTATFPVLRIRNASDNGWIPILDFDPAKLYLTLFDRVRIQTDLSGSVDVLMTSTRIVFRPNGGAFQTFTADETGVRTRGDIRPWQNGSGTVGTSGSRFGGAFLTAAPNVSSDWRLKEGFAPYTETDLAAARLFQPQTFRLKASGEPTSGYVAQQILDAFDQAGSTHERAVELGLLAKGQDGMWGVHYELVNALRIEALFR